VFWLRAASVALVVVLAAALVASVFFGMRAVKGFSGESGRANAIAAAREAATALTTFDAATADPDTQRLLTMTTPQLAAGFAGDKAAFVKSLRDGQIKMVGTVTEAGVISYESSTAHVFVTVRARVTRPSSPPQVRDYRMELTMVDEGDWLVGAAEFFS
jgi:Mce-associated membrane protein